MQQAFLGFECPEALRRDAGAFSLPAQLFIAFSFLSGTVRERQELLTVLTRKRRISLISISLMFFFEQVVESVEHQWFSLLSDHPEHHAIG